MNDEADTLLIVYQRGFADGKAAAQRKPLTDEEIEKVWFYTASVKGGPFFLRFTRAIEQAHNIKEGT